MGATENVQISVIIPTYNQDCKLLLECLYAIRSDAPEASEILLVDDGSTTKTIEVIRPKIEDFCKIVRCAKNSGPAHARNLGAREAKGEILCFVDSDVRIARDTLGDLLEKFTDKKIAAIQALYSAETPVPNFSSHFLNLFRHHTFLRIKSKYISSLSSYCIAVRKEAFFCVGGFDEAVQTPSLEDEHLGIALYNGGFNILLAKDIQVEHLERYDLQKILRRMFTMGREKIEHFSKNPKTRGMKLSKSHHPISFLISIMLSPLIPFLLVMFMIISEMTSLKTFLGYSVFGLSLAFLLINISFFRFLYHKKGFLFMGKGVCYYYLMCFAVLFGFMDGRIRYMIRK